MRKLPGHHASSSVVRFKSTQRPLVNTQRASVNAHPKIETCLPPAPLDIDALFRNPRMFDSRQAFHKSGFEVWQNNRHNIMVGSHPSAPDHLFKQYDGHVPLATQLTNYARREKVARSLREVIFEKGFPAPRCAAEMDLLSSTALRRSQAAHRRTHEAPRS